jgi:hypothetical protein
LSSRREQRGKNPFPGANLQHSRVRQIAQSLDDRAGRRRADEKVLAQFRLMAGWDMLRHLVRDGKIGLRWRGPESHR